MFKKILLIIGLTTNLFSMECSVLKEKVMYYSNTTKQLSAANPVSYCRVADALENLLNNLGSLKDNRCMDRNQLDEMIRLYTPALVRATNKCGY